MQKTIGNQQFCTFYAAQRLFGVTITDVKEIQPPVRFTPVAHATREIRGFVNIRGHIHLVIDLRLLLGFDQTEIGKLTRIVLFKPHVGESFGILVDRVGDVVEVDETRIENLGDKSQESVQSSLRDAQDLVQGICRLDDRLMIILDSAMLLGKIKEKNEK